MIILITDIGGTNCRFFLVKVNDDSSYDIITKVSYETNKYHDLITPLLDFIEKDFYKKNQPIYGVFAIAGSP